jgi:redox-sensing transcriptional repressor
MTDKEIPDIVVGRLPRYLQSLYQMAQNGQKNTSSQELGERLGISSAQIRKDLSHFGEFGKQGTGYYIQYLIQQLQDILKVNQTWDVVLVGAGDLGHAIARYQGFGNSGFRIAMVFDNDRSKIGQKIGDFIIQESANFAQEIKRTGIRLAMITVPATSAQKVAELLVNAGIRGILNYAPTPLNLPNNTYVQYIDPVIALQHMTYYLT